MNLIKWSSIGFSYLRPTVRVYRVETGILAGCENGLCCGDGNGIATA